MTTVLHLSSSARGDESATRSLGDALAAGLAGDDGTVVERHLTDAVPLLTDEIGNNLASPEGTTDSQGVLTFSDQLIAELEAADVLVIGCPLYNFGPPAALKAWADLIARGGRTFEYGENGPAGTVSMLERNIGTVVLCSICQTGTPARISACSKVKEQPSANATRSSCQMSRMSVAEPASVPSR